MRGSGTATTFTLEYWRDESWYVGRLREVPGVFSQGKTLQESLRKPIFTGIVMCWLHTPCSMKMRYAYRAPGRPVHVGTESQ